MSRSFLPLLSLSLGLLASHAHGSLQSLRVPYYEDDDAKQRSPSLSSVGSSSRYQAYDNFPCPPPLGCDSAQSFHIQPFNHTVLSYACVFKPDCRSGADGWTFGDWPTLSVLKNGSLAVNGNGGVPQRGNLSLHLDKLRSGVDSWIPDREFDGNAVLDWETWTPNWNFCNNPGSTWMSHIYQEFSIQLVKEDHPSWTNSTEILEKAKQEFESAARNWMLETLALLRSLRPKAKIGYYGYPRIADYNSPSGEAQRANDFLSPIWNMSSGYFPSVYLPGQPSWENFTTWQANLKSTVQQTIQESIRLYKTYNPVSIRPYQWYSYHNGTTLLTEEDLHMVVEACFVPPYSTGLVLWGGDPGIPKAFPSFFNTTEGPLLKKAYEWANYCSLKHCSGNGWCERLLNTTTTSSSSLTIPTECVCDRGYEGENCQFRTKRV